MPLKFERTADAPAPKNAHWEAEFLDALSRLGPNGLRALAAETERLAGLALAEGRDAFGLMALGASLCNHANRLDGGPKTNAIAAPSRPQEEEEK